MLRTIAQAFPHEPDPPVDDREFIAIGRGRHLIPDVELRGRTKTA
jgi:hypothetical protein